ncbi:hypothetical protein GCM10027030_02360 [Luteococcus sediminum]
MTGGDLHVTLVNTGIEHGGDEVVAQHVRVHRGRRHPSGLCQGTQAPRREVAIHACPAGAAQDRPAGAAIHGALDGSLDRGRQWGLDNLAALAPDLPDTVAMFLAQAFDVRAAGLTDPWAVQSEHRDQGEVVDVR